MMNKKYIMLNVGKVKIKKFVMLCVGGMNSEIVGVEKEFDDLNEVFEYCSREGIVDINGYRFRNVYDEDYWEREDFMCDCYNDEVEGDVIGVYGINEGCELVEVRVK